MKSTHILKGIFQRKKIYHQLPETSSNFTFEEMIRAIHSIDSPEELAEIEFIVDLMSFDNEFSEDQQFSLYSLIAYYYKVLIYIDDHFPHEYYPPFAIESHIINAREVIQLDAIRLHLRFYKQRYNNNSRKLRYSMMIAIKGSNLKQAENDKTFR